MILENTTKDPKIDQFLEQLSELADYYQLQLSASLRYTNNGIIPVLNVVPKIPEKKPLIKGKEKDGRTSKKSA